MRERLGKDPRFFMAKAKNKSFFDELTDAGKKSPGVGKYETLPKSRITGTYTLKTLRGTANDNELHRALNSPSQYNPVPVDQYKNKSP